MKNNIYKVNQFTTTLQYTENLKTKDLFKSVYKNNTIQSKTLILMYKKDEKHKGFSEKFMNEIQIQLKKYKEYNAFREIIIEDKDYFNIYFHSKSNNNIDYYNFNIDGINYIPHQSLDPTNLRDIKLFQEFNYPYLSETLFFIAYCINLIEKRNLELEWLQTPEIINTEIYLSFYDSYDLANEPFKKEISQIIADFYKK